MKHLRSVDDLTISDIYHLFELASRLKREKLKISKQLFAANLFFEPSTRTKSSFIVAERKLGIETLDFQAEGSSMQKGESLLDTIKTFEAIGANICIVRHEEDYWPNDLLSNLSIPVINAGAGKLEHPTQGLLDAYTIYEEFGTFDSLEIVIAGDIKHSRVAHSNAKLFERLGATVYTSGAKEYMDENNLYPYIPIDDALSSADVLMMLRIQSERHTKKTMFHNYHKHYGLTLEREKQMKEGAIIMHPAPVNRGIEIHTDLVEGNRSRIFKQMHNGVFMRMAILLQLLLNWGIINDTHIEKCKYN